MKIIRDIKRDRIITDSTKRGFMDSKKFLYELIDSKKNLDSTLEEVQNKKTNYIENFNEEYIKKESKVKSSLDQIPDIKKGTGFFLICALLDMGWIKEPYKKIDKIEGIFDKRSKKYFSQRHHKKLKEIDEKLSEKIIEEIKKDPIGWVRICYGEAGDGVSLISITKKGINYLERIKEHIT